MPRFTPKSRVRKLNPRYASGFRACVLLILLTAAQTLNAPPAPAQNPPSLPVLPAGSTAPSTPSTPSTLSTPSTPTRAIGLVAVGGQDLAIGKFHFLGIGIDRYQNPDLNLKTAVAGARELQSLLLKQFTFEKENCQLLLDAEATRDGIYAALRRLAQTAAPADSVLIYYAGHGNLDELTKSGSWIPWDASFNTPGRWIANDEIKKLVGAMKARHVLLISDSCFAGDFFRGQSGVAVPQITDAAVRRAFGLISRRAMTAGGVEPVADGGRDGQSIYTWWLLTALRETSSPYVLPEEVHDRLKKAVSANEKQKPIYGLLNGVGGEPDGTFLFFRRGTAGLDSAMREKMDRIQKLQELDSAAAEKARRQQEEIAAKQGQLTALDKRLAELQAKMGAGAGQSGLDAMLAMVEEKERKGKELETLRRKADEELKAKEAALAEARRRQEADRAKQFQEDFAKYQKICASQYASEEFKAQAWQTLAASWNIAPGIPRDKPLAYADGKVLVQSSTPSTPSISSTQAGGKNPMTADLGGGVKMELVWVPAGSFQMGSPDSERDLIDRQLANFEDNDSIRAMRESVKQEGPVHTVELDGFWMGKCEVTVAQFRQFVEAASYQTDAEKKGKSLGAISSGLYKEQSGLNWRNPGFSQEDTHPVVHVSWNDAKAFCDWLSRKEGKEIRLPTEAEWEYACRAGSTTWFCFGDSDAELCRYANYCDRSNTNGFPWQDKNHSDGHDKTAPVGRFQPNAWGLYDMHGNVGEWCGDWYGEKYYGSSDRKNPQGPSSGKLRLARGGTWDYLPQFCRSAGRGWVDPSFTGWGCGFRVVQETGRQRKEMEVGDTDTMDLGGGVKMELVYILAGSFQMGSPDSEQNHQSDEGPVHKVELDGFWTGKYEVTVAQFRRFVEAASYRTEAEKKGKSYGLTSSGSWEEQSGLNWRNAGFPQEDSHPVVHMSWNDAKSFCDWLSRKEGKEFRLPTEAEWEYACRAGTRTAYQWGDDPDGGKGWLNAADQTAKRKFPSWVCFNFDDGYLYTAPAGSFKANGFGLYDMHGNVWEWCGDWYADKYSAGAAKNPQGASSGEYRVLRGGGWPDNPQLCRSAGRFIRANPTNSGAGLGFRVVCVSRTL